MNRAAAPTPTPYRHHWCHIKCQQRAWPRLCWAATEVLLLEGEEEAFSADHSPGMEDQKVTGQGGAQRYSLASWIS